MGRAIRSPHNLASILTEAGLDWTVEKVPLFGHVDGEWIPANHFFLVRSSDHEILSEVPDEWCPTQNRDAMDMFLIATKQGRMKIHTAGVAHGGKIVWAVARMNHVFKIGEDEVTGHLLMSNAHVWGQAAEIRCMPIREASQTSVLLQIANVRKSKSSRITHRSEISPERVKHDISMAQARMLAYEHSAQFLSGKKFTPKSVKEFIETLFPVATRGGVPTKIVSLPAQNVLKTLDIYPGAQLVKGSWWQAFHAVCFHIDHIHGRSLDTRLTNAWFGPGDRLKTAALQLAIRMAEKG